MYLAAIIFVITYLHRWTQNKLKSILGTAVIVMARGLVLLGLTARLVCKLNAQAAIAFHQTEPVAVSGLQAPLTSKIVFHYGTPDGCHFLHTHPLTSKKVIASNSYRFLGNCILLWPHFISSAKDYFQDIRICVAVGYIVGWGIHMFSERHR